MVAQISPQDLAQKLQSDNPPLVVDVREPWEFNLARIPSAVLHPMRDVATWMHTLDPEAETVIMCHSGVRSLQVAGYLKMHGFKNVINLLGGIDAWSVWVDPRVPRY